MDIRSLIRKRLRANAGDVRVEGDVNTAVATNVGRPGSVTVSVSGSSSGGSRPQEPEEDAGRA